MILESAQVVPGTTGNQQTYVCFGGSGGSHLGTGSRWFPGGSLDQGSSRLKVVPWFPPPTPLRGWGNREPP